jgi:hypothetical protein
MVLAAALVLGAGCDDKTNLASDDGGSGGNLIDAGVVFTDADPNAPDAGGSAGCSAAQNQCNNCTDDDGDGKVDGNDPECTGLIDDDEGSFATGIPGDNIDSKTQDCFFDGNSGGGDDKCAYHTCCILDLSQQAGGKCPNTLQPPKFDAAECTLSQTCINNCKPLTPPGCDCFGCCTLCSGPNCIDVYTNPAVAPFCTLDTINDPAKCPRCVKTTACENPCNPLECVLCPGQTDADLPGSCGGVSTCNPGQTPCTVTADCLAGQFCQNGCCIDGID